MSRIRFLVADTLSGAYLGTLEPSAWSLQDTLATPSTGTLTLPVSQDPAAVARLADLTQPRIRWVAVQDDQGRFLWGGPIPHRPALAAGQITVPLVDWRSWFYKAPVRPNADGSWHDYIVPTATPRDQGLVMTDLMALALNTTGAPRMVIDSAPTTGFTMTFTARQLDKTIGDYLQSIQEQANGSEWWTYVTWDGDETSGRLLPHVAVGWPERASRALPIRCEYKAGKGGNASDFAWPESEDVPTRVWATGAGDPPATTWAVDEWPELVAGTEVAWETIISGSPSPSAAIVFQVAAGEVDRSRGLEGTAEFEIVDERLPIGDVMTGDRAHVILENPWVTAEVDAARIIDRTISGGRAQATKQRISVNLEDGSYPGVTDPGFPIVEGS